MTSVVFVSFAIFAILMTAFGYLLGCLHAFIRKNIPFLSFQARVHQWVVACFGYKISKDKVERNHRFLEESLELVQALGCTMNEAIELVYYVYGREHGVPEQEVGGVILTLAALCSANKIDMNQCGEVELARVWTKLDQIREKQANKPKNSPLPQ